MVGDVKTVDEGLARAGGCQGKEPFVMKGIGDIIYVIESIDSTEEKHTKTVGENYTKKAKR